VGFGCGVFVVKTWWNVWQSWLKNCTQMPSKNETPFAKLFLDGPLTYKRFPVRDSMFVGSGLFRVVNKRSWRKRLSGVREYATETAMQLDACVDCIGCPFSWEAAKRYVSDATRCALQQRAICAEMTNGPCKKVRHGVVMEPNRRKHLLSS
jgi:hypothetical protein